jgi:hypothetical protein
MKSTAPGFLAVPAGRASTAGGLPVAADPSAAGFRALALQVRAMGLLDRRPGYYLVKITLTIFACSSLSATRGRPSPSPRCWG